MKKMITIPIIVVFSLITAFITAGACTHISLKGVDGTTVSGRTMEWAGFDMEMRLRVIPRNAKLKSLPMTDKKLGMHWKAKYGFVGVDMMKMSFDEAMNEKGLSSQSLYLPGFAKYQEYNPAQAANSITAPDFNKWIVSQFATVDEVRSVLKRGKVRIVPFIHPAFGGSIPLHWAITDASGKEIVVEYVDGKLHIYDAPLGVMTNSPPYPWHLTNLRNYLNIRSVDWKQVKIDSMTIRPIGAGSALLGIPGDFTPPSRFIRAVAFKQTARKTKGGYDTVTELFRILDNFNVPAEKVDPNALKKMGLKPLPYGGTQYTCACDLKNLIYYYHTDNDRSVRKVDLKKIDFTSLKKPFTMSLRGNRNDPIDVTSKIK
ncbi:linear amide C-N hydrolase [Sulfurovum sp. NBC37-1]|uniref:linear amide C-N hydrolase n=1 Tax=Sulfurovum sp. (strain NBC37-1) TaxID=387093 RepID=UPI0001587489|nr:choloylglycine hydrolase family protein [Sulfurovum sp. NBC37-1]BAF72073.1 choloylglycine hydrolase [Sulfurovum sp. NBC37-1]